MAEDREVSIGDNNLAHLLPLIDRDALAPITIEGNSHMVPTTNKDAHSNINPDNSIGDRKILVLV